MKGLIHKTVPILLAVGGVGWLVGPLKQFINEEPIKGDNIVFACMCFTFAGVFFAVGVAAARKAAGETASRKE